MAEYRILFSIERADDGGDDFAEVGFGSSSAWGSISAALHDLDSIIGNGQWETEGDMPDPDAIRADLESGGTES